MGVDHRFDLAGVPGHAVAGIRFGGRDVLEPLAGDMMHVGIMGQQFAVTWARAGARVSGAHSDRSDR